MIKDRKQTKEKQTQKKIKKIQHNKTQKKHKKKSTKKITHHITWKNSGTNSDQLRTPNTSPITYQTNPPGFFHSYSSNHKTE
jgi:hypothetical protein